MKFEQASRGQTEWKTHWSYHTLGSESRSGPFYHENLSCGTHFVVQVVSATIWSSSYMAGRNDHPEHLAERRWRNMYIWKTQSKRNGEERSEITKIPWVGVCETPHVKRSRGTRITSLAEFNHLLSAHHLRNNADMNLGDSFSRLKKKVKHQLAGRKHKPGGNEVDADREIVDSASSLPRPEPHIVAGDGEGSGAGADGWQAGSAGPSPQPDEPGPVPAGASENDQGERGVDVEGREDSQSYPHPRLDVGVAMGSGPGQGDDTDGGERDAKNNGV